MQFWIVTAVHHSISLWLVYIIWALAIHLFSSEPCEHCFGKDMKIVLNEKKTKKERRITLNKACNSAIQGLLASREYTDKDYLFTGQRGCLTVPAVNAKVKSWCKALNLKGNYGSHSLRKTWGYHQRVTFKTDLPRLMVCFNHSTQRQTLKYLCIQPQEIRDVYENEL